MSDRDPFERMRRDNPFPPGHEPSAPMSMADRIIGARRGWPAWALTAVTAAVVFVVGLGSLWLLGGDGGGEVAADDTTTSTEPVTSVSPGTVPIDEIGGGGALYFLAEGVADTGRGGPYLIPVFRQVDAVTATWQLIGARPGPSLVSLIPEGMSTSIPEGTRFNSLESSGGVATVDLSEEFQATESLLATRSALAQVVFTLTRFDGIDAVEFRIDGDPVTEFGSGRVALEGPITRDEFMDLVPAVMIETPAWGESVGNPAEVSGIANVFEGTVSLALTDGDGLVLWEGLTTATCGTGCWGEWSVEIPYELTDFVSVAPADAAPGAVIAWEESPQDASQLNIREHPVFLSPAGSTTIALQFEGVWLFSHRSSDSMDALHGGIATIEGDCLLVDGAAVVWHEDHHAQARDLVSIVLSGGNPEVVVPGGGISLQEGAESLPSVITERCGEVDAVWFGAPGDVIVIAPGSGPPAPTTTSIEQTPCSGTQVTSDLVEQSGLPEDVAAIRESIWSAAVRCDWETLRALAGDDIATTFGEVTQGAVDQWQEEEDRGREPMRYLAEILQRPFGTISADGDAVYYVWPSVFAAEDWSAVSQAERDTLRPLYGDDDFSGFDDFGGYFGYRVGIYDEPGIAEAAEEYPVWSFFVAGD